MAVAAAPFLLGLHGEIQPGEEIPATFSDIAGEHPTDFDRLHELGLIADPKPAPAPERPDEPAAKPKRARARKPAAK